MKKTELFRVLLNLIHANRQTMWVLGVYSLAISLLSLIVPLSVQSLINVVTFGALLQPVFVLTMIMLIVLMVVSCLRIGQAVVIEHIQQHIFVNVGLNIASLLPKTRIENYENHHLQELVNRFFEVTSIQKSLSVLLIVGIEIALTTLFSMILLAFYHPLLLVLDVILLIMLFMSFWLPWKSALKYAIKECDGKHIFALWLQEIAQNIFLFKTYNPSNYALAEADKRMAATIKARQKHFKSIIKHLIGVNSIYVFGNTALLGIGGYLVVKTQLSVGQLVAAELILNAVLYNFVRFSSYLEDLYDLIASSYKLDKLINLPVESSDDNKLVFDADAMAPTITLHQCSFERSINRIKLPVIEFTFEPTKASAIVGHEGLGKSLLIDLIMGFREPTEGLVYVNDIPLTEIEHSSYRSTIALFRNIEFFTGTLRENLLMNNPKVDVQRMYQLLDYLGLADMLKRLPKGLETLITPNPLFLSYDEMRKLMLVRALLRKPQCLIIDIQLDKLDSVTQHRVMDCISKEKITAIIATNHSHIAELCDRTLVL